MSEPVNQAQQLADALGGRVRVQVSEEELRARSPREVEALFRDRLKQRGIGPGGRASKGDPLGQKTNGTIEHHRPIESNVVEAIWTPER